MMKQKNPHDGSSFEDFLKEEGIFEKVTHSATQRVLALLMEHGDDLSRVREVEHFAYFPTPDARAAFIDASIAAGFKLRRTSEPSEVTPLHGVILFHLDAPDEDALEKIIGLLSALAEQCSGEYDGWETQILGPGRVR
jgi:regulator of RNase E activity RraB